MTRESRCGLCGVRVGEASHPGPPQTRARAQMEAEAEAEVVLSGLEAAVTHIDSDEEEFSRPIWRDEACAGQDLGRR